MTCSLINIFTVILYFTAIFEYHGHMRLRSSPTHQPTDHQLKFLLFIQLFLNPFPWGQGVDSVIYPGPSIHPIMSLQIYIFTVHICNLLWNELNKYFCLCLCLSLAYNKQYQHLSERSTLKIMCIISMECMRYQRGFSGCLSM